MGVSKFYYGLRFCAEDIFHLAPAEMPLGRGNDQRKFYDSNEYLSTLGEEQSRCQAIRASLPLEAICLDLIIEYDQIARFNEIIPTEVQTVLDRGFENYAASELAEIFDRNLYNQGYPDLGELIQQFLAIENLDFDLTPYPDLQFQVVDFEFGSYLGNTETDDDGYLFLLVVELGNTCIHYSGYLSFGEDFLSSETCQSKMEQIHGFVKDHPQFQIEDRKPRFMFFHDEKR